MKIVLVEDVPKVGEAGEITTVADGFARNYLIPRGLAVLATKEEVHRAESRRRAGEERRQKHQVEMGQIAALLEGQTVALRARVGPSGRLYGSITGQAIAQAVAELLGQELDHRVVELEAPLRVLGEHQVLLRLAPEVVTTITVRVEAEGQAPAAEATGQPAEAAAAAPEAEKSDQEEEQGETSSGERP